MSSFEAAQPPAAAATADQVTIDVENGVLNANNRNDQMNMGLIAVDGRRHGNQRHGSGGHHHSGHESDADDTRRSPGGGHRQQRHRRRSRSRTPSPSQRRAKRATDTGVS